MINLYLRISRKYMLTTTTIIVAFVTMYGATGNPAANGQMPYIGSIACPRNIPFGTSVQIKDKVYTCTDRTAKRYDGRFDIYSEGTRQDMLNWGKRKLPVTIFSKDKDNDV